MGDKSDELFIKYRVQDQHNFEYMNRLQKSPILSVILPIIVSCLHH